MSYPGLSAISADKVIEKLRSVAREDAISIEISEDEFVEQKEGTSFNAETLREDAAALHRVWLSEIDNAKVSRDSMAMYLEVQLSERFYNVIHRAPLDAREDPDFWRWLALFPFRWYLLER